jgi:hypothetical protein
LGGISVFAAFVCLMGVPFYPYSIVGLLTNGGYAALVFGVLLQKRFAAEFESRP